MVQIDQQGETVGLMSINIMPIARDEETLQKSVEKLKVHVPWPNVNQGY